MPLDMKTSNPPVLGSNTGRHTYVTVRLTAKWATSDESVIARPSTPPPPPPPPPAASALIESLLAAFRSAAAPGAVLDMATAATTPAAKTGLSAYARRLRLNIVSPRDKYDGPPGAPNSSHRHGPPLPSRPPQPSSTDGGRKRFGQKPTGSRTRITVVRPGLKSRSRIRIRVSLVPMPICSLSRASSYGWT